MNNQSTINGSTFVELLKFGYKNLLAHIQIINDLNVFPVPDGDTGTNMKLTYSNGLKTISDDDAPVGKIADEFARGMLFGARGNSGVLTSQYYRGFADVILGKKELGVQDFALAMVGAYKNAYNACAEAAEGTILTVARESIEAAKYCITGKENYIDFLTKVVLEMRKSLDNTPNLLPVLKENGVVDSGGKGLLTIFEGYLSFFTGKDIDVNDEGGEIEEHNAIDKIDYSAFNEDSELDYGYCTEFLLQLLKSKIDIEKFDINEFISWMQEHGESLVCFQTGTIVKTHIHTKKPYEVIEYAQKFGEFVAFKMENMALQHNNVIKDEKKKNENRKKLAIITIAQGDGVIEAFKGLRCDLVLNGGQTMNTSVSEMIDAFNYVNADTIILLPNESNMIKTAHQAADLYKDSEVKVIETKNIQEGFAALNSYFDEDLTPDEVYDCLMEGKDNIIPLTIFKSGKDANIDGDIAPKGSYVEAIGHRLIGYKKDIIEATIDAFSRIKDIENKSFAFMFVGQMVDTLTTDTLIEELGKKYPQVEIGLIDGKQDVYDLLIGLY